MEIQIIDLEDMTILDINKKIKDLENKEQYYLDEMNLIFEKTQPKAVYYDKLSVDGGKREDKFMSYVIQCDEPKYKEICKNYELVSGQRYNLTKYVERKLKIIGEYDPLMKIIVELRETGKHWEYISEITHYSDRQCRRIYKRYKMQRNV